MRDRSRTAVLLVLLASALVPSALAQQQPARAFWADRWNGAYHSFTDLDGDGSFIGAGEVAFHIDPASPASSPALALQVTEENGQLVTYWLIESDDTICRGVDGNGDGTLSGHEIQVFRDSGALDGNSWPQDLDVTDDGAVWWSSGLLLSMPQNGLSRLEDLNADGDAADPGEQVLMVDGNAPHVVEHDLGSTPIGSWYLGELTAAGNAMIAFSGLDGAAYRFEDQNADGDVLDAGESILLINATGELPGLPMNPDFADGTLRSLQSQAGYPASFRYMASALEGGKRVFYLGTDGSPFGPSGTNLAGQGINFLIFRGVDGNADGDINDAGEVKLHFNGSHTDGDPELLILRGLDALDGGTLYAVGLKPYPVLGPGPNGNTWIHRLEDLNGDGDAHDAGEQLLDVFDLQAFGDTALFPSPPGFGNIMSDPWDFVVHRTTQWTDMGGASAGSFGPPALSGSGPLTSGSPMTIELTDVPPGAPMLAWLSFASTPQAVFGGTLYPLPNPIAFLLAAGPAGSLSVATSWPPGVPAGTDLFLQFLIKDTGAATALTLSNALKLTTP
ncbi:MAG TPA: hypothetical protein VFD43_08415 [Planctomycetota bacterium]|nr:hypothetical protein [Planctomycetota bacterium]